jgi:hypothetical protein
VRDCLDHLSLPGLQDRPGCKIGKIPAPADLFDHMKDAPVLGETKVP